MKPSYFLIPAVLFFSCSIIPTGTQYYEETRYPVPSKQIFPDVPSWNTYATKFIYAPVFRFDTVVNAGHYHCTLSFEKSTKTFSWDENQPVISLSKYWPDIPSGMLSLKVKAIGLEGDTIRSFDNIQFYHSAPFTGIKNSPKKTYHDAAVQTLQYIYNLPHVQEWLKGDEPDLHYSLYGYPSKIISSLIDGMLSYSGLPSTSREDSVKAMKIALNMAHYLVKISTSESTVLSSFVPTYNTAFVAARMKIPGINNDNGVNDIVQLNAGKLMMLYGYSYGNTLLDLYDRTKNREWYDRAVNIADAYAQLQLPDGTWYLKLDFNTAQPLDTHLMMPSGLMMYLKRLEVQYGKNDYEDVIHKAVGWIQENPLKTFYWEGQFEDVPSYSEKYRNLSEYPPTNYAMYLLKYEPASHKNTAIAKELVRFSEDQFVIWEEPSAVFLSSIKWNAKDSENWLTPCVLEQYHFYVPVDASSCQMIYSYMTLYKATRDSIYIQKATALANSITQAQQDDGQITTVWTNNGFHTENWLNCMVRSARTLLDFDREITSGAE